MTEVRHVIDYGQHTLHPQPPFLIQTAGNFAPRTICPDLLNIRNLGAADGWRGHLVRGIFRVLRWTTGL